MDDGFEYQEIDISQDQASMVKFGIQSVPSIVILNGSGEQAGFLAGVPEKAELEYAIEAASR